MISVTTRASVTYGKIIYGLSVIMTIVFMFLWEGGGDIWEGRIVCISNSVCLDSAVHKLGLKPI